MSEDDKSTEQKKCRKCAQKHRGPTPGCPGGPY
jgi:hypothetical protein